MRERLIIRYYDSYPVNAAYPPYTCQTASDWKVAVAQAEQRAKERGELSGGSGQQVTELVSNQETLSMFAAEAQAIVGTYPRKVWKVYHHIPVTHVEEWEPSDGELKAEPQGTWRHEPHSGPAVDRGAGLGPVVRDCTHRPGLAIRAGRATVAGTLVQHRHGPRPVRARGEGRCLNH